MRSNRLYFEILLALVKRLQYNRFLWNIALIHLSGFQSQSIKLFHNFNFRVGLGRISELGYGMLFGSDVKKQFFQKRIKGRGYCDVGTSVISEFYTPLVPKGHLTLQIIADHAAYLWLTDGS